jgi:hypothetical protein
MARHSMIALVSLATLMCFELSTPVSAQGTAEPPREWAPDLLSDGQPNIQGLWNNVDAIHTPLELPDALAGQESFTQEELQAFVDARSARSVAAGQDGIMPGTGFYDLYWFDWYWRDAVAGDWPALLVEPTSGKMPAMTEAARDSARDMREHIHDTYANMEAGDRCLTRGVLGMMMPTAYNNGTLIVQAPGYVVLHSEMIHNARIIPLDGHPHVTERIDQWDGDPRGHWEGTTLVVESTNFKAVDNLRMPRGWARQTEARRLTERFTVVDQNTLRYSITVDDPATYTEPWTVAFPLRRDDEYQQFEYACHEGNYSVPNMLAGARNSERQARASSR